MSYSSVYGTAHGTVDRFAATRRFLALVGGPVWSIPAPPVIVERGARDYPRVQFSHGADGSDVLMVTRKRDGTTVHTTRAAERRYSAACRQCGLTHSGECF